MPTTTTNKETSPEPMKYHPSMTLRIGYNTALGAEGEAGIALPLRLTPRKASEDSFIGPVFAMGYSEAGLKCQAGITRASWALGGGAYHIALEFVYIKPDRSANSMEKDKNYYGIEVEAAAVGPGGGYGLALGYLTSDETDKSNIIYFGIGVGM